MNYEFPVIRHINKVLPAVEGREEFIVAEREGYTVVNYNVVMPDTFGSTNLTEEDVIRRECRGIIFDENGVTMSRPFHKFFNVNEREETQASRVDLSRKHTIFEKADGSMIRPLMIDGHLRLGTKMGITDIAMNAEAWLARQDPAKARWMKSVMQAGFTPLFEWVSPKNKIVVDYEEDDLILLAIRETFSGRYLNDFVGESPFTSIQTFPSQTQEIKMFIDSAYAEENCEGYVLRFEDGHCVKVKNDWYVRIHKALDRIRHDRHLVNLILEEELDDLLPNLPEADVARIHEFEEWFWNAFNNTEQWMKRLFEEVMEETEGDRKRIALEFVPTLENKKDAGLIFKMLDGVHPRDLLLDRVRAATGSNTKWDEFAKWLEK